MSETGEGQAGQGEEPGAVSPTQVDVNVAEQAPATAAQIEEAVNKRLASCGEPFKVNGKEVDIKVSITEKSSSGGKRNRRKTRSKRSARKSHKSRRVFGGKRK